MLNRRPPKHLRPFCFVAAASFLEARYSQLADELANKRRAAMRLDKKHINVLGITGPDTQTVLIEDFERLYRNALSEAVYGNIPGWRPEEQKNSRGDNFEELAGELELVREELKKVTRAQIVWVLRRIFRQNVSKFSRFHHYHLDLTIETRVRDVMTFTSGLRLVLSTKPTRTWYGRLRLN